MEENNNEGHCHKKSTSKPGLKCCIFIRQKILKRIADGDV